MTIQRQSIALDLFTYYNFILINFAEVTDMGIVRVSRQWDIPLIGYQFSYAGRWRMNVVKLNSY